MEHTIRHKHHAVRSFVLTVGYPGSTDGQSFRLFGTNKETIGRQGAEILRTLAARKGISAYALDYAVR